VSGAQNANRRLLRRLLLVCGGTFVFAFSMVPLYRLACTKVFGIKLEEGAASAGKLDAMGVDNSRWVTVEFDTSVNSELPWKFGAEKVSMRVHPGQLNEALFWAQNVSDGDIVGQAVPSIAPSTASLYFNKTECFCFTQQRLDAGERRRMPVRFVVDPALPDNVDTLTLSYTFFENELATRKLAQSEAAEPAGS